MDKPVIDALAERVERLERENRRLKRAGAVSLIGALLLTVGGAQSPDRPPSPPPPAPDGRADLRSPTRADMEGWLKGALATYESLVRRRLGGEPVDQEIVYIWSRRVLRSQLRLSEKREDRVAAFRSLSDRARSFRDGMYKRMLQGDESQSEFTRSTNYVYLASELYGYEIGQRGAGWQPLEPIEATSK
jgi:hypothetical protein